MTMKTINVTIPFSGFYESLHDSELDTTLERMFSDDNGDAIDGLVSRAYDAVQWRAVHTAYAKSYAERFAHEFEIAGLAFESLQSPREYNFTTDRIFVDVPADEMARILSVTPRERLDAVAAEMFTSRSGFMSFYSPDVDDWGDSSDWDHNQWGAVLRAYVLHMRDGEEFDSWAEYSLMEDDFCNGACDEWMFADATPEFRRIDRVHAYLRQRGER